MKFRFIAENANEYPVKRLCLVLGVDESSYYKWRKRLPSCHQLQDEALREQVQEIYKDNLQVYGSPRIHVELRESGLRCSRHPGCSPDARARTVRQKKTASVNDHR